MPAITKIDGETRLGSAAATAMIHETIDKLGVQSATAQGLGKVITSSQKLRDTAGHWIYLANEGPEVVGFLKVARKNLYLYDAAAVVRQVEPLCVLDFFVKPEYQRRGIGKALFDYMLQETGVRASELAIDGPSPLMEAFLARNYGLTRLVRQSNNFAVSADFFTDPTTSKSQCSPAAHAAPVGRFAARRPVSVVGDIIHGAGDRMYRGPEVVGCLKVARKNPYLNDAAAVVRRVEPLCVLDFLFKPEYQRRGIGKALFDFILQETGVRVSELAIEAFLARNYGLTRLVRQSNNFAVSADFFTDPTTSKCQCSPAALALPVGRIAARRRPVSVVGDIIHGNINRMESKVQCSPAALALPVGRIAAHCPVSVVGDIIHGNFDRIESKCQCSPAALALPVGRIAAHCPVSVVGDIIHGNINRIERKWQCSPAALALPVGRIAARRRPVSVVGDIIHGNINRMESKVQCSPAALALPVGRIAAHCPVSVVGDIIHGNINRIESKVQCSPAALALPVGRIAAHCPVSVVGDLVALTRGRGGGAGTDRRPPSVPVEPPYGLYMETSTEWKGQTNELVGYLMLNDHH